jgi:hypothetical protein
MPKHNHAKEIFYVTEGTNAKGQAYETCESYNDVSDDYLRTLMEEFIHNRANGPARLMISNRVAEDWT